MVAFSMLAPGAKRWYFRGPEEMAMHRRGGVCNVFPYVLLAVGLALGGCGGSKAKAQGPTAAKPEAAKNEPIKATIQPAQAGDVAPPTSPIYFDFDKYDIQDISKAELQQVADYLSKHPGSTVTISGHTDERGTTEYNLMLGDQRAKAAHDYLVRLGIDPLRIKTISFGEERPAVQGTGEDAWSKNRRDEFQTGGDKSTSTPK
jgi:peptidoglycan-associated lipoprotein